MKGMAVVALLLLTVVVARVEGGSLPKAPSPNDKQKTFSLTHQPRGQTKGLPKAMVLGRVYEGHPFHETHGVRAK
ncbi:MAG TPA: hypothetical protein VMT70_08035 [Vicinamibacteria bacterium]|nr:hypothetical protein [Vicinamibacteria bacterium]